MVFDTIARMGHEEVLYGSDPVSGLRTIIAIHSTALGPALGGTRFFPYAGEEDALTDVLRLSRGMSYKAAAAGLDLGGGKAVIIGSPDELRSERLWRAYGRIVDSLGGRYITAEDVGTTTEDMELVRRETRWALGIPQAEGGSGDPSPATARGLVGAMKATADRLWGTRDLAGRRIAIQGLGKVGYHTARLLVEARCEVVGADTSERSAKRAVDDLGVKLVPPEEILFTPCDILAPCAMGAVLNTSTIPRLDCAAVVGSANNQLATDEDADRLQAAGILYAPDFVVNAGGLINVYEELRGYNRSRAEYRIDRIADAITGIYDEADRQGMTPQRAATAVAERRMKEIGDLRRFRRSGDDRS